MIIYRASISGVSKDLYESAEMDGAGPVRRFSSITLPSIRFPLIYTFVMTTAGAFNVFGQPLMMTDGGPRQSTTVLMMYIRAGLRSRGIDCGYGIRDGGFARTGHSRHFSPSVLCDEPKRVLAA